MKKYHVTMNVNYAPTNWRIPGIKVLRFMSGLGLKEAKDIHDSMGIQPTTFLLNAEQVAELYAEREQYTADNFPFIVHSIERVALPDVIDLSNQSPR